MMRAQLGYTDAHFVVGAIGNLYPVKGHRHLLAALARTDIVPHCVHGFIAGRGEEEGALRHQIRTRHLDDRVKLLGFREDAADLLQAMDAFVLPSESEGLPLSLLEAMAVGRPVISSAVGGIPAVLTEGCGVLVPPGDVTALANAIADVARAPERCRSMGRRALERVRSGYSAEAMYSRYQATYETAVASR